MLLSLQVKKKMLIPSILKVNGFLQARRKTKLKKKWRFWRSFKFYFLRKKSLSYFSKLKWFFNQTRIIWHYFTSLYGKKIKSLIFNKTSNKIAFGKSFIAIIVFLELRLNILLLRMRFATKQLESNILIKKGFILVNGALKTKNYLARINDIIKKTIVLPLSYVPRLKTCIWRHKWRKYKWISHKKILKRRAWKLGKKRRNVFWLSKTVLSVNFLEINYVIWACLLIKLPTFGEVLISKSQKYLSSTMLKKIYFLF